MAAQTPPGPGTWSDPSTQPMLQLMVEAAAEMAGFEQVVLLIAREGVLTAVAHAAPARPGDDVVALDPALLAPRPGRLRFVGAGHTGHRHGRWQAGDLLLGILTGDDGRPIGVLRVDRPLSGRRPDAAQRRLLERCAAQTERAVLAAFEREQLRQQIGHAEAARRMVRSALAPAHTSLQDVLEHTHRPLVEGFRASGSWIEVCGATGIGRGYARARNSAVIALPTSLVEVGHDLARRLWTAQRTLAVPANPGRDAADGVDLGGGDLGGVDLRPIRVELARLSLSSVLIIPLGAGEQCLGFLALGRRPQDPPWSAVEEASALQIGHDLGAALRTTQALERERALVRELQQLDDYRSELIATLSHELRTPLTVISGNLEMLGALDICEEAARHQQAMTRGAQRMQKVVDDLLLLARVSDPQHPLDQSVVDLRDVIDEVLALGATTMQAKQLDLDLSLPATALKILGSPDELDRMVGNLVSNAVKYTEPGGRVRIAAERKGDRLLLTIADTGIGIAREDQQGLFRAFYRTSNPEALRRPGTGLGLAIVATIAKRHRGTVAVESTPGQGTTFTVTLPTTTS